MAVIYLESSLRLHVAPSTLGVYALVLWAQGGPINLTWTPGPLRPPGRVAGLQTQQSRVESGRLGWERVRHGARGGASSTSQVGAEKT